MHLLYDHEPGRCWFVQKSRRLALEQRLARPTKVARSVWGRPPASSRENHFMENDETKESGIQRMPLPADRRSAPQHRLKRAETGLVVVDIQERLLPMIFEK